LSCLKVDEVIKVSEEEANKTANCLVKEEGVFVGICNGGSVAAASRIAKKWTAES